MDALSCDFGDQVEVPVVVRDDEAGDLDVTVVIGTSPRSIR